MHVYSNADSVGYVDITAYKGVILRTDFFLISKRYL